MAVPVISPGGPLTKRGKEVQAFTATGGVTTWSTTGGTLSGTSPTGATWTAPNKSGTFTVTATNGDGSDVVTITVTAEFPNDNGFQYYSYRTTATHKKKVLMFEPEEGARQYQLKQDSKITYEVIGAESTNEQWEEVRQFWSDHYPGLQFYFNDIIIGVEALYQIDSDLKYDPSSRHDRIQWSLVIREV